MSLLSDLFVPVSSQFSLGTSTCVSLGNSDSQADTKGVSASKSQDFAAWYTQVRRIFGLPTPSASEVSESDQQNVSRVTLEGGVDGE